MNFINLFHERCHNIFNKFTRLSGEKDKNFYDSHDFYASLNKAILYWYDELRITDKDRDDINKCIEESKEIIQEAQTIWVYCKNKSFLKQYLEKLLKYIIKDSLVNKMTHEAKINMDFLNVAFVIVLAFVIVAVYYLCLIFLKQNPVPSNNADNILVLVINAVRENLIEALQTNGQVTSNNWEELYTATQVLWVGSESVFVEEFQSWFNENKKVTKEDQSEYDVYLVKIYLRNGDPGFKDSASQVDRYFAFRNLLENSQQLLVSPRLSSKAYGNKILYNNR